MLYFETFLSTSLRRSLRVSLLFICLVAGFAGFRAGHAEAHVKWFAPFEVAGQPRVIEKVLSTDFVALSLLALALMVLGCILDRTALGEMISRSLDRVTAAVRANEDVAVRATCAFFLVAVWTMGGTLLTPELKTSALWVPQLQLAMAATLLTRRTAWMAGVGIIVLYAVSVRQYGIFHLLDYPIFLGVALYLIARSVPRALPFAIRPLDLLRWSASITLMWASVEKWAYPEWTLPMFIQHPELSMGYDFELFMRAAGVIEFTLAFALIGPSLVRRASALVLLGMFLSATAEFGKLDVIGHSVIVAVLLVISADAKRAAPQVKMWRRVAVPAMAYTAALVTSLSLYYGMHAILFGTTIT